MKSFFSGIKQPQLAFFFFSAPFNPLLWIRFLKIMLAFQENHQIARKWYDGMFTYSEPVYGMLQREPHLLPPSSKQLSILRFINTNVAVVMMYQIWVYEKLFYTCHWNYPPKCNISEVIGCFILIGTPGNKLKTSCKNTSGKTTLLFNIWYLRLEKFQITSVQ